MLDDFGKSPAKAISCILQHLCNIPISVFKHVAESPIVAKIMPKSRHISTLRLPWKVAVPVNQVAKIEKSLGWVFCPSHAIIGDELRKIVPPTDTDWQALPDRFLDGITFASRFAGGAANSVFRFEIGGNVHCSNGRAYATDNRTLIEYDMGAAPTFYLTPKHIAPLDKFGAPTHMSGEGARLNFKWANGNLLTIRGHEIENKSDNLRQLLDAHVWNDFRKMDPAWRDQIIGHFSY